MRQEPESQNMNSKTFPSKYTYSTLAHKHNIKGLDDCIQTLHKRALSAEAKLSAANTELMALRSENMRLRRQIEAIADPPPVEEGLAPPAVVPSSDEGRFPIFG